MNTYELTVPLFLNALSALERCLDRAIEYATEKKFDPEILLQARLAPDQFAFLRQVTAACDSAKWAVSKLAGKDAPAHPDAETGIAELRARIAAARDYLQTFSPEDFAGAEERACAHSWMGDKYMRGSDYLKEFALPNFFFHVATAYAILRHNGVPLGKPDYIGRVTLR